MADYIRFDYTQMSSTADEITSIAQQYASAADTFTAAFESAITEWTGESKDAMLAFIKGSVNEYLHNTIPEQILKALADLLVSNANEMGKTDQTIASNLPK